MSGLRGTAMERIPFGAPVLCRGFQVRLADPSLANGTARERPLWGSDKPFYKPGEFLLVEPVEGLGARDLHAMANGPLMDPKELFLPAGKLSMADYRARVAADLTVLAAAPPKGDQQ